MNLAAEFGWGSTPRKVTAVTKILIFNPSSPLFSSPEPENTLFPSLQHTKQHPFLDSAPPFGCHLVCLLPFPAILPERVSASSFLSACHLASTLPTPGGLLQPRAPHDFPLPKSKCLSLGFWTSHNLATACLLTFCLSFPLLSISFCPSLPPN